MNRKFEWRLSALCLGVALTFSAWAGAPKPDRQGPFKIAFLTDVHLNIPNHNSRTQGMRQAVAHAKSMGAQLLIFGGDNADLDKLKASDYHRADSLFGVFKSVAEGVGLPAYYTIGNHDRFYYHSDGTPDPDGTALFNRNFGEADHTFDFRGIRFIVINSVLKGENQPYYYRPEQLEWLQGRLREAGTDRPIILITHVPLVSLYYPAMQGRIRDLDVIANFGEIWKLLEGHHIVAVLQGHQHLHEEMLSKGIWFLTGGSVCGNWWVGDLGGTQEGYLMLTCDPATDTYSWEYVDYGWIPEK